MKIFTKKNRPKMKIFTKKDRPQMKNEYYFKIW